MDCKKGTEEISRQVLGMLLRIPESAYQKPQKIFNGSSIGQHFRHIIEFYHCLLEGAGTGRIDYASRKRDIRLEQDIAFAKRAFRQLSQSVKTLDEEQPVEVLADFTNAERPIVGSTLGRELMFAYDHAVHHLAMIRIGLEYQFPQLSVEANFGIAPSTVKHNSK
jgi:uncharacterized damage-inducible protein DinB